MLEPRIRDLDPFSKASSTGEVDEGSVENKLRLHVMRLVALECMTHLIEEKINKLLPRWFMDGLSP